MVAGSWRSSRRLRRASRLPAGSPLDKPPAVLVDRAQQILRSFGYTDPIADSAYGFALAQPYIHWIAPTDQTPAAMGRAAARGTPAAMMFWYRTSPRNARADADRSRSVTPSDPPMTVSGMT